MTDSFGSRATLRVGGRDYRIARLDALEKRGGGISRLPYACASCSRTCCATRTARSVTARRHRGAGRLGRQADARRARSPSRPARVLLQDFTGVPGRRRPGRDARRHGRAGRRPASGSTRCSRPSWSSTTRCRSTTSAAPAPSCINAELEYRAQPRALRLPALGPAGLRQLHASCRRTPASSTRSTSSTWPASSFARRGRRRRCAYPDTLVGTDSHTTMINGLGVLGWGVGGIEAEAAMLGQPVSMLIPAGGRLPARPASCREGATATDLVLTVTADAAQEGRGRQVRRVLRPRPGRPAAGRPRHHRQHGARVRRDLRHLPGRRRDARATCASPAAPSRAGRSWSRPTCKEQGLFHTADTPGAESTPTRSSWTSAPSSRASPGPTPPAGPRAR